MTAVAVTGIGVVSALGHGVEPFWRGLVAGASGLRPIRRFEVPPGVALGGEVPPLERREVVLSAIGRRIDWVSLMALAACRLALADAGLGPGALEPARTGLGLGSAWGNLQETAAFLDRLFARGQGNPLLFPNLVFNAPLSYASIELGITGPTAMLSAEEASGEAAIAWGAEQVGEGAVDVCLAGGADELGAVLHQVLREGRLLARAAPRPLDPAADGACPGEGAAVLVLEPLTRAGARRSRPCAAPSATSAARARSRRPPPRSPSRPAWCRRPSGSSPRRARASTWSRAAPGPAACASRRWTGSPAAGAAERCAWRPCETAQRPVSPPAARGALPARRPRARDRRAHGGVLEAGERGGPVRRARRGAPRRLRDRGARAGRGRAPGRAGRRRAGRRLPRGGGLLPHAGRG